VAVTRGTALSAGGGGTHHDDDNMSMVSSLSGGGHGCSQSGLLLESAGVPIQHAAAVWDAGCRAVQELGGTGRYWWRTRWVVVVTVYGGPGGSGGVGVSEWRWR
jgi:hypothetical protein